MAENIQQNIRKVQAIADDIHKIDGVIQRVHMSMDKMEININNIPIVPLLPQGVYVELREMILTSLGTRRSQLMSDAEQLMR